jgi:thiamine biosynthesis protein ThiI
LKAKDFYLKKIEAKSFVVRVKRSWKHNFSSIDLERYVWWGLLKFGENCRVQLKNPDLTIKIEIKDNNLFLVREWYKWVWGYPVGTQDKIISLISWGFDSWVSTFQMMRRWCKTDFLFFNLGWTAHELGVKQVSSYLWKNFGVWYDARFITVPFENIVKELVEKVDSRFRWILLKRYFLKIADKLAREHNYYAIVKWDSLGQVSSQTLKNMHVIDKASETLVLRPLIW